MVNLLIIFVQFLKISRASEEIRLIGKICPNGMLFLRGRVCSDL